VFAQGDDPQPLKPAVAGEDPFILLPALPPPVTPFEARIVPPAPPAPFVPSRRPARTGLTTPLERPVQAVPPIHTAEAEVAAPALGARTSAGKAAGDVGNRDSFFVVRVTKGVTHVLGSTQSLAAFERGRLPPARRVFVRQSPTGGDIVFEEDLLAPELLPRLIQAYNVKFNAELNNYSPAYRVR